MHTQNLRGSAREVARYFTHWRGWTKYVNWEICFHKNFLEDPLAFKISLGGDESREFMFRVSLLGLSLYLTFPRLLPERFAIGWYERDGVKNPRWHEDSMGRDWGFYIHERCIVFLWGSTTAAGGSDRKKYGFSKCVYFPWDWGSSIAWDIQKEDGSWGPIEHQYDSGPYKDGRKVLSLPYAYKLRNEDVQQRIATFHVSRMEWRWRVFHKLRVGPKFLRTSICVDFNQAIGEDVGSWKGGTTGCGYDLRPGETPVQCLRRMETERKFER